MRILIILVGLCGSVSAHAEATTGQFLTEYEAASDDGRRYLDSFLKGLVAAYTWSNVTLQSEGKQALFCLNTTGGEKISDPVYLLRLSAKNHPGIEATPVGMALLVTLKRRWPCRASKAAKDKKIKPMDLVPTPGE